MNRACNGSVVGRLWQAVLQCDNSTCLTINRSQVLHGMCSSDISLARTSRSPPNAPFQESEPIYSIVKRKASRVSTLTTVVLVALLTAPSACVPVLRCWCSSILPSNSPSSSQIRSRLYSSIPLTALPTQNNQIDQSINRSAKCPSCSSSS